LKDSFLFRSLDDQQTNTLIDSMLEHNLEAGDVLINQDDEDSKLFVVDRGELEAYSKLNEESKVFKHFFPSDSLGEIALMYDHKYEYSVRAKKASVVYSLSRSIFRSISQLSVREKRDLLTLTLPKMDLFKQMDSQEINQLADTAQ